MATDISNITLTQDQEAALDAFYQFLVDPTETVFVLSGYSGCGKSTLVSVLLDRLPNLMALLKMVNPSAPKYDVQLTATTNKAAENLAHITGQTVATIHSYLGLRVFTDYATNVTKLVRRKDSHIVDEVLLFIDEGSYVDSDLLGHIFQMTRNCKIVFIGDPAQLAPVKSSGTPVFNAGFKGAALRQVVRQAEGNPIVDLSTKFRNTVNTGEFFSFVPDGVHIQHMSTEDFVLAIEKEFLRPDWRHKDSKILAWTNKRVVEYNQYVSNLATGNPDFQDGDYVICNCYFNNGSQSIKTDQMVQITGIGPDTQEHGVIGRRYHIDGKIWAFMPYSLADKASAIKQARQAERLTLVSMIENTWIDLRAAYASTVNKSQGSTYDKVFIDLTDISKCNNANTLARMLYVAVSRARNNVFFVGDLVA